LDEEKKQTPWEREADTAVSGEEPQRAPAAGESSPAGPEPEPAVAPPEPVSVVDEHEGESSSTEEHPELVQKRTRRASRKELLELVHRKNIMLQELEKRARKAEQDLATREDRFVRLAAEFENYKKRTRREWELLQKQANADLIKEIIGGIDNFDRAFANLGGEESRLHEGIRLIHAGLVDILKKAGLTEIEALNQKFDPQYHEAVGEIESSVEEGHVAEVIQRGYELNGQVLRPARVIVSRKKA
jgi:molecular chaperone GrpE